MDFLGLNVYTPSYVRASDKPRRVRTGARCRRRIRRCFRRGFNLARSASTGAVRNVCDIWKAKVPAIYITENGTSSDDVLTPDGRVEDTDRVMYLRNHLTKLHRAVKEDYPVKGYFLWSLMDNFEWADGYSKRFGIHYVDFKTLKRNPKLSAQWYKQTIAANAVV